MFTHIGSIALRVYLYYALWSALYANNGPQQSFSFKDIITYSVLALLVGLIYNVDGPYVVREKIREGNIAIDLMRPISVPLYVFADTVGQAGFALVQIAVALPIAIGLLALTGTHVSAPASPLIALAFLVSVALGFLVNFFLDLLMATITFWTMEIFGFQLMVQFITSLLAGAVVPLQFFPSAVTAIAQASPFAAIYNAPLSIYLGKYQGPELLSTLALQAVWVVVFAIGALALWRVGERRVVVQGG
ncbi:MAG: ABC-2 family transporter protein [Candidatus Eremiobacteraeota bacterium]|nr:ABC-2 family transporter protein [Candidatus Eremiobacteraeota bacterium]